MNSDQTNAENGRIDKENTAKDDAYPDLPGIKLTRISLVGNHTTNSSHHPFVYANKLYLALIYGNWHLGQFGKVWYGWNFTNWGTSGIQLDHIQILYETDLVIPNLNHASHVKFRPTICEWCETKLPESDDEHCTDENGHQICYDCWRDTYA